MKVIAYYLPQFHAIPENDEMWGEGFTEWVNVKKAKKLYKGHNQPRIPMNNNYYNLLDESVMKWQVDIAKDNGIYGFCFYHYWFDGKKLLERPIENFLYNKNLDINFCLCWANEPWTKAWVSKEDTILYEQKYGEEDSWRRHFMYLLSFFQDDRYIKENNKPLLIIYRPEQINCLNSMLDFFDDLARENGFDGMIFAYQHIDFDLIRDKDDSRFSYNIEYEPLYAMTRRRNSNVIHKYMFNVGKYVDKCFLKIFNKTLSSIYIRKVRKYSYDEIWEKSNNVTEKCDKKLIAGAFVDWDNTPRRGMKGTVIEGASPEKFKRYFREKVRLVKDFYSTDYIFVFSWNECAEGGYLEPDEKNRFGYLNAIRDVVYEEKSMCINVHL